MENRLVFQNVLHCNCTADYNCSLPLGATLGVRWYIRCEGAGCCALCRTFWIKRLVASSLQLPPGPAVIRRGGCQGACGRRPEALGRLSEFQCPHCQSAMFIGYCCGHTPCYAWESGASAAAHGCCLLPAACSQGRAPRRANSHPADRLQRRAYRASPHGREDRRDQLPNPVPLPKVSNQTRFYHGEISKLDAISK